MMNPFLEMYPNTDSGLMRERAEEELSAKLLMQQGMFDSGVADPFGQQEQRQFAQQNPALHARLMVMQDAMQNRRGLQGRNVANMQGMSGADLSRFGPAQPRMESNEIADRAKAIAMRDAMTMAPQAARGRALINGPGRFNQETEDRRIADQDARFDTTRAIPMQVGRGLQTSRMGPGGVVDPAQDPLAAMRAREEGNAMLAKRMEARRQAAIAGAGGQQQLRDQVAQKSQNQNAMNAFKRGALNPFAEAAFANQGVIPNRAMMEAQPRIAIEKARAEAFANSRGLGKGGEDDVTAMMRDPNTLRRWALSQTGNDPVAAEKLVQYILSGAGGVQAPTPPTNAFQRFQEGEENRRRSQSANSGSMGWNAPTYRTPY